MNRPGRQPQPIRVFGTDVTTRSYIDPAPVIETSDGTLRVFAVEIESTNPGRAGLIGFPLTKRGYVSKHPRRVEVALDWLPDPVRELVDPEGA